MGPYGRGQKVYFVTSLFVGKMKSDHSSDLDFDLSDRGFRHGTRRRDSMDHSLRTGLTGVDFE